ncbi:uncharacterized protein [Henckelia pumila]|uniref:uncharacterized protein n=1 Tax=Henckelia pumila TaxID=405737 RepID=UPI003C6E33AD
MNVIDAVKSWFSSSSEEPKVTIPVFKDNEVLIKVWAVGVNRDDIVDVATSVGFFHPGFECSGIIEAVGRNASCWKVGERVCAILEGGGYAEQVAVPADFLLPLPDDIDLDDAAGLPYASCCIWSALFKMQTPDMLKDKIILIHEGFNGIGPLAIQYAKYMGLKVIVCTGNRDKLIIDDYGADFCVDCTSRNFASEALKEIGSLGFDIVLDYGFSELERNITWCKIGGNVVIVYLGGDNDIGTIDLLALRHMHIAVKVTNLRHKDFDYKASVIAGLRADLWPAVLEKVHHRFPASEAQQAFDCLKKKDSVGKIIVRMDLEKSTMDLEKSSGHFKMQ